MIRKCNGTFDSPWLFEAAPGATSTVGARMAELVAQS